MYDFKIAATDPATMYRDLASALGGLIAGAVWKKWGGHRINHPDFIQPIRTMSSIGG